MKSRINTKKQEQYKKFMAKDAAFLKKVVGGEDAQNSDRLMQDTKIKI